MTYAFASATILLLLVTDPFGNIPIFVNALRNVAPERRIKVILREGLKVIWPLPANSAARATWADQVPCLPAVSAW